MFPGTALGCLVLVRAQSLTSANSLSSFFPVSRFFSFRSRTNRGTYRHHGQAQVLKQAHGAQEGPSSKPSPCHFIFVFSVLGGPGAFALTLIQKDPLPTTFACLFCNHENSVSVKLDKKAGVGQLDCRVCGQKFQCAVNCTASTDSPLPPAHRVLTLRQICLRRLTFTVNGLTQQVSLQYPFYDSIDNL